MGTRCTECGLLWSQRVPEPVKKQCTKCKWGYVKCSSCARSPPCRQPGCLQGQRKCTACNGVGETLSVSCSKYKTHNKS